MKTRLQLNKLVTQVSPVCSFSFGDYVTINAESIQLTEQGRRVNSFSLVRMINVLL